MEEIGKQFTGTWVHTQDDLLPNFFDAVGASEEEKQYMLGSTPKLSFTVDGDHVKTENSPYPITKPEENAKCDFKLNEEFTFEHKGFVLKITVDWKDGQLIQNITPVDSHICPHIIELHINNRGQLIQVYKLTDANGKEVKGTRTFRKEDQES
ncbi:uncharacterized protein LOC123548968 [Mercenaria mercenaria]|uniref:uncharacterized protein LOC123548968 n=1 Tax=Mercenaria mercenaria TaxID=6596 RepID=UPI001E1D431F|nr:uncharacterized protein LOC123548968 [Mercenaria mercenaria]XP_045192615.1 uncharacterized protein LOC123548968 [Mercenaria mercenaria]